MTDQLLAVNDLAVSFAGRDDSVVRAVDGVHLSVRAGRTLAVVGESGSGKSVTALSIMRLLSPAARIERGSIVFEGRDLLALDERAMLAVRGGRIAMIFQEPMTSLNPVFTIGEQIIEAVRRHRPRKNSRQSKEVAIEALNDVRLPNPAARLRSYPHELSGGMRQRVMIAMALACRPRVLLADEPTTALDVTIQAEILSLLRRLRDERNMGMMLITHDLGIVADHADEACVMFAGRVVERAVTAELLARPLHPYTRGLLSCRPGLGTRAARLRAITEIVHGKDAFAPVIAGDEATRPWWPATDSSMHGNQDMRLREVAPSHWVACRSAHAGSCA